MAKIPKDSAAPIANSIMPRFEARASHRVDCQWIIFERSAGYCIALPKSQLLNIELSGNTLELNFVSMTITLETNPAQFNELFSRAESWFFIWNITCIPSPAVRFTSYHPQYVL